MHNKKASRIDYFFSKNLTTLFERARATFRIRSMLDGILIGSKGTEEARKVTRKSNYNYDCLQILEIGHYHEVAPRLRLFFGIASSRFLIPPIILTLFFFQSPLGFKTRIEPNVQKQRTSFECISCARRLTVHRHRGLHPEYHSISPILILAAKGNIFVEDLSRYKLPQLDDV